MDICSFVSTCQEVILYTYLCSSWFPASRWRKDNLRSRDLLAECVSLILLSLRVLKWLRLGSAICLSRIYDETNNNLIDISFQIGRQLIYELVSIELHTIRAGEVKFQECIFISPSSSSFFLLLFRQKHISIC